MTTAPLPARSVAEPSPVPFYRPDIGEEEIAAVVETLRSGWITVGPRTQEFEQAFARFLGAENAVAVGSCTAALHLALDALDLQPGDEVITSTITFTSTAATIVHAGGHPVLADVCADTLNLDPVDVARKITPRTRAIVPVHYAGHPVDMDELQAIAGPRGIVIIEDAAHALPASYKGRRIGTIGDATAFSFYATKNLCTGEGGMLTTARADLLERFRTRRLHGMSRDAWKRYSSEGSWRYDVSYPGFKYNLTDTASAMGLVQLRRLPEMHARRLELVALYGRLLGDCDLLRLPIARPEVEHGWHLYVVRFEAERLRIHRDQVIEELKARGIGSQVHFIPIHQHSWYRSALGVMDADLPVASAAADTMLSLPFYTQLSNEEAERVASVLREILHANRR